MHILKFINYKNQRIKYIMLVAVKQLNEKRSIAKNQLNDNYFKFFFLNLIISFHILLLFVFVNIQPKIFL